MKYPQWIALFAIAMAASLAQAAPGHEDIVIAQVAPLTGVIAGTGNEYVAGGAAYFAHVNDNSGIDGRKIRVALKDNS